MEDVKIALINLGCSKNLVDSEIMLSILAKAGYKVDLDDKDADIVLINTCSFIKNAEKESVRAIMEQVSTGKKVIIVGCLAQKYRQELLDLIPEVAAIVGTSDIGDIAEVVKEVLNDSNSQHFRLSSELKYLQPDNLNRFHITVGPYSYLKISEGCNWRCSYCLIPELKGMYRSRKIESIVKEAETLVKNGVSEIVIIAQDTTSYGIDLYKKPALKDLLLSLDKIEELKWIRLMYTYPKYINDDLINVIANSNKIVKYIDLPLQHAHPDILRAMGRPDVNVELLIEKLRSNIENLAIRTCFIVGFPGETDEKFDYLYNFIKSQKFERLGVFEYSKENNTPASKLPDQLKAKIKKQRRKLLMELQQDISLQKHQNFISKKLDVLLEKVTNSGAGVGRSYLDAPEIDGLVYISSVEGYLPGDIIPVKINKVTAYDLYGIIEN